MIPEHRLDRAERILTLIVKAGYRERREWRQRAREQDEKINILINAQIKIDEQHQRFQGDLDRLEANQESLQANEEGLQANQERLQANQERLQANQERLQANEESLQASLKATQSSLKAFLDSMRRERNGGSSN